MHPLTHLIATLYLIPATLGNPIPHPPSSNGVMQIINSYHPVTPFDPMPTPWLPNFTTGITPIPCHSHNDYNQAVPLYQSIAAGCVSTEIDIYIHYEKKNLRVGHWISKDRSETLKNMYFEPLKAVLEKQNANSGNVTSGVTKGVFDSSPSTSLVLLVDFKDASSKIWRLFKKDLEDLGQGGWLTYWTPETGVVQRPLTIVVSGDSSYRDVVANTTYRDVFIDAPLGDLKKTNVQYNSNNSYYASIALPKAIGKIGHQFSDSQTAVIVDQVQRATALGLKTRYWDAPRSPAASRLKVWESLVGLGVSVLNVDDLVAARNWYLSKT